MRRYSGTTFKTTTVVAVKKRDRFAMHGKWPAGMAGMERLSGTQWKGLDSVRRLPVG